MIRMVSLVRDLVCPGRLSIGLWRVFVVVRYVELLGSWVGVYFCARCVLMLYCVFLLGLGLSGARFGVPVIL